MTGPTCAAHLPGAPAPRAAAEGASPPGRNRSSHRRRTRRSTRGGIARQPPPTAIELAALVWRLAHRILGPVRRWSPTATGPQAQLLRHGAPPARVRSARPPQHPPACAARALRRERWLRGARRHLDPTEPNRPAGAAREISRSPPRLQRPPTSSGGLTHQRWHDLGLVQRRPGYRRRLWALECATATVGVARLVHGSNPGEHRAGAFAQNPAEQDTPGYAPSGQERLPLTP